MPAMTRNSDPIPDRLRGSALLMILLAMPAALMPVGVALGANLTAGYGVAIGGSPAWVVNAAMIPWLSPIAAATVASALFVYFGRGLRVGLSAAIGWAIGTAFVAPVLAIICGLIAYWIFTGRRRMEAGRRIGAGVPIT
jgi:hypothetical protein